MDLLGKITGNNIQSTPATKYDQKEKVELEKTNILSTLDTKEVILESSADTEDLIVATYKPDMDKVMAMKEESDARMLEMFRSTIEESTLKQLGGYRGIISSILNGEETGLDGEDFEITEEAIEQAKEDIAEGGYWSAEETSTRLVDFAKAISGGDSSKADMLVDAFKEGFELAQEQWGGELPEISKNTYDLTLEKFEHWKNGDEETNV